VENQPILTIDDSFIQRFCARDATLWAQNIIEIEEIAHRLAWLDAPHSGNKIIQHAETLLDELLKEGFTHALVIGMGGSSLAPEVLSKVFQGSEFEQKNRLELSILDSTDPEQIKEKRKQLPIEKTVFIVSSKSGGTAEVNALEAYFWNELKKLGIEKPGSHFIAVTDPSTSLEKKGREKGYRQVIQANPDVGGRYSALIEFGLVPAILMGIDGYKLLSNAKIMEIPCEDINKAKSNPGVVLGTYLAAEYKEGRDKLTIIADPQLESVGSWIEQLIAESSGKNGRGILPVDLEPMENPNFFRRDRIFVYFSQNGQNQNFIEELAKNGHPILTFKLSDPYALGAEFLKWEIATAVMCALIGVNAFDQPNVQLSKTIAQQMISEIKKNSGLKETAPIFGSDIFEVYGDKGLGSNQSISDLLNQFLIQAKPDDYLAINAFVTRNDACLNALQTFRHALADMTKLATTLGFGPRFMHSTGQLQKGGRNNGHFLIITAEREEDIEIPGEEMSFGTLQIAQAVGDMRALQQQNRSVIRLHFKKGKFSPQLIANLIS
jgi:transaldolase / glucose-6-phosphate isomerase